MESFLRITLSNGLLVLLKEIHSAPLISHWLWFRVGSRDERPGSTGISHWVEHMQFKGTPRFPADAVERAIARQGGYWNALTYLDWTTYYETLPAHAIELALEIEADRMVNSRFDPQEVETERTVIISERQGNENEPLFLLNEEVQAAAFRVHSYHHEVIGDLADLQALQRDDLYRHYRTYYVPSNAVLSLAGHFDSGAMLELVRRYYEPLPSGSPPRRTIRPEPPQSGERRVTVEGPGDTTYLQVAYHAPQATHPDFFPLLIADSLLSGPGNLNLFAEGLSNRTSRLYRALVERDLAVSVFGSTHATLDPYLYHLTAVVHPQSNADQVLRAIDDEIQRLQENAPDGEELARAVRQARALFAYGSESITNQAFWLGFAEMFATYEWYATFLERLEAVTPAEVQRVAQTYLRPQNRVVGVYLPQNRRE